MRVLAVALLLITAVPSAEARPSRQRVIVMVGLPGAGKTTVAKSLSRRLRAPRLSCGDVVRGWIRQRGLPYNAVNDRMAAQHFARRPGAIARAISKKIVKSKQRTTILDGVRSSSDLAVLKKVFDVRVVAVEAPTRARYRRMLARRRFEKESRGYLKKRDQREIGLGVLGLIERAELRVNNSGKLSAVPSQARSLAKRLSDSWSGL